MSYVVWFKDITKESIALAGGKGANLGEMTQLSLSVPNGFAVTAQCYGDYITRTSLKNRISDILSSLDVEDNKSLQQASANIEQLFSQTPIPEDMAEEIIDAYELLGANRRRADDFVSSNDVFVAVRSSATAEDLPSASFAGQQATFLNIKGKSNILEAVRSCWASLFTARAIYYRVKNKFDHDRVLISALVQKMVNSDKSGIMFTINPATNNAREIVIEAIYGLGEMIVGGEVNPDLYIVNKATREIETKEIRKQAIGLFRSPDGRNQKTSIDPLMMDRQKINDAQIKELSRIGRKLEEHYHCPQDIEWAVEGEDVFIVQTRAVTTFKSTFQASPPQSSPPGPQQKAVTKTSSNSFLAPGSSKLSAEIRSRVLLRGEVASRGVYTGVVKLVHDTDDLSKVTHGDVMVTPMTMPDMVPAMQRSGAIVTDEGGMTCHAAIVSREMGTPCLVGTQTATTSLKDGQLITVDAISGLVYDGRVDIDINSTPPGSSLNSTNNFSDQQEPNISTRRKHQKSPPQDNNFPSTRTKVKIVLDLPYRAKVAAQTPADGIGLVRSEIIIAQGGIHPAYYLRTGRRDDYVKLLKDGLRQMASAFKPRPIWVRTSDMRSDEYRNLTGGDKEPHESDPMIGWHGIRRHLDEPELLKSEFLAIKELHDEGFTNIGVMIPFVIRTSEVSQAKAIMREVGLEPCRDIDFGIMCETPAACWVIEDICREGISFVSFGTNDLTQLTLGLDRNNAKITPLFDEMHPAVLGQIERVMEVCHRHNIKTSICGQAGSRPEMVKFLVARGIDSISANLDVLPDIKKLIHKIERKEDP